MVYQDFIKLSRYPTTWCAGCGAGIVLNTVARAFDQLGFTKSNTAVVSGIGCSGRGAGYFAVDSAHGLHGRAVPLAEGMKLANPDLNVLVFSGDGDLLSIGLSHLIHACRRNTDITVICINNNIYGMTGGQKAPTTPQGVITPTSPEGVSAMPINAKDLVRAHGNLYARTTVMHADHMNKCIIEAIKHKGLGFVEIISPCTSNYGRRQGFKTPHEMMLSYKENYRIIPDAEDLSEQELAILR